MRKVRYLCASLLAVVGALLSPAVALAATQPVPTPPTAPSVINVTEMTVTGFDAATARKYGHSAVQPQNVVGGNCGSSYLFLDPRPRVFFIRTGFSLTTPAVSYSWAVDGFGPTGFRATWDGGLFFRTTWDGTASRGNLAPGFYNAIVSSPSYALLANGLICSSAHPTDAKPVF